LSTAHIKFEQVVVWLASLLNQIVDKARWAFWFQRAMLAFARAQ
jgi:hypothetical protein